MKKILIIILLLLEIFMIFLTGESFSNRNINEDKEIYQIDTKKFAMYTKNEDGTYTEYTNSNYFPTGGYIINEEKSRCIDNKGVEISDLLNTIGYKITVTSNKTAFCHIYFDFKENLNNLCNEYNNMNLCMNEKYNSNLNTIPNISSSEIGGMYRYQGLASNVTNNYICFGTQNMSECINDTDKYMYRIIGINNIGQMKLIKKEALNNTLSWYSSSGVNITWPDSTIISAINGEEFLKNPTYVPSEWEDKIMLFTWKYGDVGNGVNKTASEMYLSEMTFVDTHTSKVSIMYIHDYYFQSESDNCSPFIEESKNCKLGWMHLLNNDSATPSVYEQTLTRHGIIIDGVYYSWYIHTNGSINWSELTDQLSIRPVFYLENTIKISDGNGTIENPYIIS